MIALLMAATLEFHLQPGQEYQWQPPCVIAKADPHNRVERLTLGFLSLIDGPKEVLRCVQPEGSSTAVMFSLVEPDGRFLIVYNQELEGPMFSELAVKGIIAHEVAHQILGDCDGPFYRPSTVDQHRTCEAAVDRQAATWAGQNAMEAGLVEFHKFHVGIVVESLRRTRDLIDGRLKMLKNPQK